MKAKLKFLHSPDVLDLVNYVPEKLDNFGILLQVIVGLKDIEDSQESFDMFLCTPLWLQNNNSEDSVIFGRHYLIVFEYNYQRIFNKINDYINACEGTTWDEVAGKISRIGKWEFEDYKP